MDFSRYTDRHSPTWSITTGTAKTGYPVIALGDLDPSTPFWANETAVRVVADLGSPLEVQAVYLFAHTFTAGLNVRVQANASDAWGSPTLDQAITIPTAYRDGFTVDAALDLRVALPSAGSRTFRYWAISNVGAANGVTVAIGEVWLAATVRQLTNADLAHDYLREQEHLVSRQRSKRGVQAAYDLGSRARGFSGTVRIPNMAAFDEVLDWDDDQHGAARPMVVTLDPTASSRRLSEPHLARFTGPKAIAQSILHDRAYTVALGFEELGRGELIGA